MRGIPSFITDIRKQVFSGVARMAYSDGDYTRAEDSPYKIIPYACHANPYHAIIHLERPCQADPGKLVTAMKLLGFDSWVFSCIHANSFHWNRLTVLKTGLWQTGSSVCAPYKWSLNAEVV